MYVMSQIAWHVRVRILAGPSPLISVLFYPVRVHVQSPSVIIIVIHTKVTTSRDLDFMAFVHNLSELQKG